MSEQDWKAAYQRACQEATLALSGKVAAEARAKRLRLTDAERSLLDMLADHPVTHQIMPHEVATLRGLLDRTNTGEK